MKLIELERAIRDLVTSNESDADLRAKLEGLAKEELSFAGLTYLWGPALYRRNRVLFRPFILSNFSTWLLMDNRRAKVIEWKGETAKILDAWLQDVDRADDVAVFRRLYDWKLASSVGWHRDAKRVREFLAEVTDRFRDAPTAAARQIVLQKFDLWFDLDEKNALEFYRIDPVAAGPYILRRLPSSSWGASSKRVIWHDLWSAAKERGDMDFQWKIYRRQVPIKQWEHDALSLARTTTDPRVLIEELERRHPEGWDVKVGDTFHALLQARGRDVLPYVMRHVAAVRKSWFSFGRDAFSKLRDLANQRQWWDFWSALIRISADQKEFDAAVATLVRDTGLPEADRLNRLGMLAGISREFNWGGFGMASIRPLADETAEAMYRRYPDLVRGPFRSHVQASGWGPKYKRLLDAVLTASDEEMIDFLASRFITRIPNRWNKESAMVEEAERLSHYYEAFKTDDATFTRRAATVLGQVPAYSIWNYHQLIRENRLARLFFERSARGFLGDARSIADLVEAPEIHVQALAYRALGLNDERALSHAIANLPILIGTLLRPLHRATRMLAFEALANAASAAEPARIVLDRARDALTLPDVRYPKEQLLGLIATVLHRFPEMRSEREQPTIYVHAA